MPASVAGSARRTTGKSTSPAYLSAGANIPWSKSRRVQRLGGDGQPIEEARYEGFDATANAAAKPVMQGGTAAITSVAMLRTRYSRASSMPGWILQVHDELLWECPESWHREVLLAIKQILEQPPAHDFQVPISVKLKWGRAYGEMTESPDPPA